MECYSNSSTCNKSTDLTAKRNYCRTNIHQFGYAPDTEIRKHLSLSLDDAVSDERYISSDAFMVRHVAAGGHNVRELG